MSPLREQPCDVSVPGVFLQEWIHTLWKKCNLQSAWIPPTVDSLLTHGLRGSRLAKRDLSYNSCPSPDAKMRFQDFSRYSLPSLRGVAGAPDYQYCQYRCEMGQRLGPVREMRISFIHRFPAPSVIAIQLDAHEARWRTCRTQEGLPLVRLCRAVTTLVTLRDGIKLHLGDHSSC